MRKITASLSPLYKPAVYAELCSRSELKLFVALQNDIHLSKGEIKLSSNLAHYFGFAQEGGQIFLGIPNLLWPRFREINFQSFVYRENYLRLYYNVDVERVFQQRTATGFVDQMELSSCELAMLLPMRAFNGAKVNSSVVLHLVHMNEEGEKVEGQGEQISISKKTTIGE